jgi:hypothetical protein
VSVAKMVDELVAAGATPEVIAIAVRHHGEALASAEKVDAKLREARARKSSSQARWRAKRSTVETTVDATVDATVDTSVSEGVDTTPRAGDARAVNNSPKKENTGKKEGARKMQACLTPEDWQPTAKHFQEAAELGVNCGHEAIKFRNYGVQKQAKYVDHNRAFSAWLVRAAEFKQPPKTVTGKPNIAGLSQVAKLDLCERAKGGEHRAIAADVLGWDLAKHDEHYRAWCRGNGIDESEADAYLRMAVIEKFTASA